jgi:REP element-mobilizing transposase RayT
MPQSLSRILVHLIFSTKNRASYLQGPQIRRELEAYIAVTLRNCHSPAIAIGAVADHAHILCILAKTLTVSKLVEEVKSSSSKWLKTKSPSLEGFYWQSGYGAFSVSEADCDSVCAYIVGQEEHHRTGTFQEEFRQLLREHGVEFDERYVWD